MICFCPNSPVTQERSSWPPFACTGMWAWSRRFPKALTIHCDVLQVVSTEGSVLGVVSSQFFSWWRITKLSVCSRLSALHRHLVSRPQGSPAGCTQCIKVN